ncbi:MAG: OmpH family outer membrane protein [Coprobacter sp.]|nr:OmpH family outer membrane protein [Coprobacter sp.]
MKTATRFMPAVLALAVALLCIQCQNNNNEPAKNAENTPAESKTVSERLPIAYIRVDSLLIKYEFAKDVNEKLLRREENARATLNEKARELEKDGADFQRKYQNNAFLSQDRFEQEQQRLLKKQQDLQLLQQRLENEMVQEADKMNAQVNDSVMNFIKEYNQDKKYEVILNNIGVLYIDSAYDITNEIVDLLNKRYKK